MEILTIESGPVYTLGYLVFDKSTKDCIIIDVPLESSDWFLKKIREMKLKLKAVFLTHSHWDHTAEAANIKYETNADIYIHKDDEYRIINPNENTIWKLPFILDSLAADKYFEDGMRITFTDVLDFNIIHTPGHTEGSVCIYNDKQKFIFTGDTLFCQSIGRTDLPGGNSEQLINSIKSKLMILNDDIKVFSGHGDETSIGNERTYNPFLKY